MKSKVDEFFEWFTELTDDEKQQVISAVIDPDTVIKKGLYSGPLPMFMGEGRFSGPAPTHNAKLSRVCSKCGRAY